MNNQTALPNRWMMNDPDRLSPKHDEITMWLDQNIQEVVSQIIIPGGEWIWNTSDSNSDKPVIKSLPARTIWEHPVISWKSVSGYIDLVAVYSEPFLDEKFNVLFRDAGVIAFEVKTKLSGIGDLIRQISLYRQYTQKEFYRAAWFLVIPDPPSSEQIEILRKNHIGVILYPYTCPLQLPQ